MDEFGYILTEKKNVFRLIWQIERVFFNFPQFLFCEATKDLQKLCKIIKNRQKLLKSSILTIFYTVILTRKVDL